MIINFLIIIQEVMSMQIDVSVIIPVYNVENYIDECIQSILAQNFVNMEIICVEDGSIDDSLQQLIVHAEKDSRIKIIQHDKNKGLSAARNTGLEHAVGKYVLFVDSDDYLATNALKILYQEAEEKQVDIVYFNYIKFFDSSLKEKSIPTKSWKKYDKVYTGKEFFCMMLKDNQYKCEACRQFLRRDFLVEHQITFLPGILHEDNLFSFYTAMEAQRVCNLNKELYYYRQREHSIMQTKNIKRAQSMFVILGQIYVYWKTHSFTDDESYYIGKLWESLYQSYIFYQSYGNMNQVLPCGDQVDQTVYRILNNSTDKKWLNVDEISMDELNPYENVIVYGAGHAAKQVIEYLGIKQIEVNGVMVESKNNNPTQFCGINVREIEEYNNIRERAIVIIGVTSKYADGIVDKLNDSGFKNILRLSDYNL